MASSKDTFEAKTFAAVSFASGAWRGVGIEPAINARPWDANVTYFREPEPGSSALIHLTDNAVPLRRCEEPASSPYTRPIETQTGYRRA